LKTTKRIEKTWGTRPSDPPPPSPPVSEPVTASSSAPISVSSVLSKVKIGGKKSYHLLLDLFLI